MRFVSTRGNAPPVPFAAAVEHGLAPDGGLYVPEEFPRLGLEEFVSHATRDVVPRVLAPRVLAPFFGGDVLEGELDAICRDALSFPTPLVDAGKALVLELFWGPTAAFKDVGARFLVECFARLEGPPRTVLVATSGDTGGAVAAAFHRKPNAEVVILFPEGGVSPEQEHQLTCWGDNVHSFRVRGTFDDCQRLLKEALGTPGSLGERVLTTANSINIARLLPQMTYHGAAALQHHRARGCDATFVVPTGNVGNATAALWAKRVGFPIARVVMVTNDNRTVPDYLESGAWQPRPSRPTLANAMDVGDPSNMERVFSLYPDVEELREDVVAVSVDDATIRQVIAQSPERWGRVFDPHTATAAHVVATREDLGSAVIVATAHPAKFQSTVEPLVGHPLEVPEALVRLRARPASCTEIDPDLPALRRGLGRA